MKKRIIYTAFTLLWMLVIYMMSAQSADVSGASSSAITVRILGFFVDNPSTELVDTVETLIRKMCHFFEYAVLCMLCYQTLLSYGVKGRKLLFSLLIAILYAVTDEVHQYFVPARACRFYDVVIDSLGALSGYFVIKCFKHMLKGKNSQRG